MREGEPKLEIEEKPVPAKPAPTPAPAQRPQPKAEPEVQAAASDPVAAAATANAEPEQPVKKRRPAEFISPTASSMGKVEPSLRSATTTRPMPMMRFSPVLR